MQNIERVTSHIRHKLKENDRTDLKREVLTFRKTQDGLLYFRDDAGNYWRACLLIKDSRSYDIINNGKMAGQGGKAFGRFQNLLADLPVETLFDTIPNFHNVETRLHTFFEVIQKDPVKRVKDVLQQINFVEKRSEEMMTILKLGQEGKISRRTTHNDTKFNNVLFDNTGKALCVIDLDTVMPGYVHYDFGDAIRTGCNTGAEDDPNLENVKLNIEFFEAYSAGFLQETSTLLNTLEIKTLAFSARLLTFIMGLRFLTDYIDGDNYYKIHFENHNLRRANAQFKLLKNMEERYNNMQEIVLSQAEKLKSSTA